MISTVLRRSVLGASRRNLSGSLTSINAALFHHLTPAAAARVPDLVGNGATDGFAHPPTKNSFVVKARELHFQSGPSEFSASMVSPAGFAMPESRGVGDSESFRGSSGGDGLAISELGIAPEIVKALSSKGIEKLFPIQKAVLEPAMQGRDRIGRARTGTGKTLALGFPSLTRSSNTRLHMDVGGILYAWFWHRLVAN